MVPFECQFILSLLDANHYLRAHTLFNIMPGQIVSPNPVTPPTKNNRLAGSSDLFASLNATLESKDNKLGSPVRSIQERDWDVPAPPPPSPVSFHPDHWQYARRR
ncbi:hypothetical protein F5Y19DRAFT_479324 [Xylariaceae sp. FL1651]|nr:hypothetical protein F5Y19DRAFT_479324 [Xylariaceae sp. FL1651]